MIDDDNKDLNQANKDYKQKSISASHSERKGIPNYSKVIADNDDDYSDCKNYDKYVSIYDPKTEAYMVSNNIV